MKIDFYNFQNIDYEKGFVGVIKKAFETKSKICVKVKNKEQSDFISKLLWEYDPESWLPHGTKDQEKHPIFINEKVSIINDNSILIVVDGSDIPFEISELLRCLVVFNGNKQNDLERARTQYKQCLEKKIELQYYNL